MQMQPVSGGQPTTSINNGAQSPGVLENIKDAFVGAGTWVGKNVQWLGSQIADFAVKVYQWAKPAFVSAGQFIVQQWENGRTFVMEHKSETIVAAVSLLVGALIYALGYELCCRSSGGDDKGKVKA